MTGPTTTNTLASAINNIVDDCVKDALNVAEVAAEAAEPILAMPVVKQLFEYFAGMIVMDFFNLPLRQALTKLVIQIQTYQESASCMQAWLAYQSALSGGDPNAIATAKQSLDAAFIALIEYDGSAPVTKS